MGKLNSKVGYWIEDFENVRRLCFGCYYPDDVDMEDYDFMVKKQSEYLAQNVDLSKLKKMHIRVDTKVFVNNIWVGIGDEERNSLFIDKNIILNDQYQYINEQQYYKKRMSYITMYEITSDNPEDVAINWGFLVLVPKKINLKELAKFIYNKCK